MENSDSEDDSINLEDQNLSLDSDEDPIEESRPRRPQGGDENNEANLVSLSRSSSSKSSIV